MNPCTAYWTKKLRRSDYAVVHSFAGAFLFTAVLAVLIIFQQEGTVGLPVGAMFLHFMLLVMSLTGNLETARKMHAPERIMLALAYLIVYVCGIVYLTNHWDLTGDGQRRFF